MGQVNEASRLAHRRGRRGQSGLTADPAPPDAAVATPPAGRRVRRRVKRILGPVAAVAAVLYFLIDAVFFAIIRPIARAIGRLRLFEPLVAWLSRLGPYPTLALFLVPLVVLEPVKPVALYLIATSHMASGVLLIAVGEVLKITIVERLFHFSRDKLMSIRAFAWAYNWVMAGVSYFQAQPLWQAVSRQFGVIRQTVKEAVHRWFRRLKRLSHSPT